MTIKERAEELSAAFERRTRDDNKQFVTLRDGSPEWMKEVCRTAHGGMFPDDIRYEYIEATADLISETESIEDARDSIESDIYTRDLTAWLGSRAGRYSYCDEAIEEYGWPGDTIKLLQLGQHAERAEVFDLVVSALESHETVTV